MWRRLSHPNITPFYGIDTRHFELAMVCKWMPHGHINGFLRRYPCADRPTLVCRERCSSWFLASL